MTAAWTRRTLGAIAGLLIVAACTQSAALGNNARVWIIVAVIAVSVVSADALSLDRRLMPTRPVVPLALAATAFATYVCVPETDHFRGVSVVLGLAIAIDLLADAGLSESAIGLAAALVLWAGIEGGVNRQSAFVGALFAWWPIVLLPLVVAIRPRTRQAPEWLAWAITAIGAVTAVVVARTGGLADDVGPAVVSVVVAAAVSLAVACAIATASDRRPPAITA